MVVRIHAIAVHQFPALPQGGGAVGDHEAPARIGLLFGDLVSDIGVPVRDQRFEQIFGADVAGGEVIVVGLDVFHQVLDDPVHAFGGNQVHIQRNRIGGLVVGAVSAG